MARASSPIFELEPGSLSRCVVRILHRGLDPRVGSVAFIVGDASDRGRVKSGHAHQERAPGSRRINPCGSGG